MSKKFNDIIKENLMGPDTTIITKELIKNIKLKKNAKILDLGCGKGLSSIILAKKFKKAQIFAVDLWINPEENYNRFKELDLHNNIIPLKADANNLPFAKNYFDLIISVDAYHYFGLKNSFFKKYIKPYAKENSIIKIAVPGMKKNVHKNIPDEMKKFWKKEDLELWQTRDFYVRRFKNELENLEIKEMKCNKEAWENWLNTDNPYAIEDKEMMKVDNDRYMTIFSISGITK